MERWLFHYYLFIFIISSLLFCNLHDCVRASGLDTRMNHPTNRLEIDTKTDRDEFVARQTLWNPDERLIMTGGAKKKYCEIIRKDKEMTWNEIRIGSDSITVAHSRFTWNERTHEKIPYDLICAEFLTQFLMRTLCWGLPAVSATAVTNPSCDSLTFREFHDFFYGRLWRGEREEEQLKPAHIS